MPTPGTGGLNDVGRDLITQALAACGGNKSKAAERLGISRTQLHVRRRQYDCAQAAGTPTLPASLPYGAASSIMLVPRD